VLIYRLSPCVSKQSTMYQTLPSRWLRTWSRSLWRLLWCYLFGSRSRVSSPVLPRPAVTWIWSGPSLIPAGPSGLLPEWILARSGRNRTSGSRVLSVCSKCAGPEQPRPRGSHRLLEVGSSGTACRSKGGAWAAPWALRECPMLPLGMLPLKISCSS